MTDSNILITGGFGCIGASTARWLIEHTDARIVIASRRVSEERSQRTFGATDAARLKCVQADVCDSDIMRRTLAEYHITHVLHLAGLQTPDCNENRDLGLQVNLAGTQNLIEAMKSSECSLQRFVFASSMAVYGARSVYGAGRVPMNSQPRPVNVYGVWKLAAEHLSRLFQEETGVPTISIRPGAVFGPGRDVGLTATPTTAMKHVVLGRPYEIPYRNQQDYLYAPDVGAAFANSLHQAFEGYAEFTLPSHTVDTTVMVEAMRLAAITLGIDDRFHITIGNQEVPFIRDVDYQSFLDAFPNAPHTPLDKAVHDSIAYFLRRSANENSPYWRER